MNFLVKNMLRYTTNNGCGIQPLIKNDGGESISVTYYKIHFKINTNEPLRLEEYKLVHSLHYKMKRGLIGFITKRAI